MTNEPVYFTLGFDEAMTIPHQVLRNLTLIFGDRIFLLEECIHNTQTVLMSGVNEQTFNLFKYNITEYMYSSITSMLDSAYEDPDFEDTALSGVVDDIDITLYAEYASRIAYDLYHGLLLELVEMFPLEDCCIELVDIRDKTGQPRKLLTELMELKFNVYAINMETQINPRTVFSHPLIMRRTDRLGRR